MIGWLRRAFGSRKLDADLDKELRFHLDARTDDLVREGHSREEARRLALAEFGGLEPIREVSKDARGTRWLIDLWQDLRYARRVLWANKTFTAAAILSLGVGLGVNAAVFRVMDSLMFRALNVPRPHEIFFVESARAEESRFSHPAYLKLAEAVPQTQLAVATPITTMQISVRGVAQLASAQLVSGNWFEVMGVSAAHGRLLAPTDDQTNGREAVVVMGDRLWARHFARDPSVVGSTLMVNGVAMSVVGITPPEFGGFNIGSPVGLWMPVTAQPLVRHRSNAASDNADSDAPWVPQDGISWLMLFGRAEARVDRIAMQNTLKARYQQILTDRFAYIENQARRERAMQDRLVFFDGSLGLSSLRSRLAPALQVLLGMSGLVLVVACANLANLLLVRGVARHREFALRLAIGARRGRLIRQLLVESMTLAALGGALGLLIAVWGGQALLRVTSTTSAPIPLDLPLDWRVLGLGVAAIVVTGLAFGLLPAIRLSRPQQGDALKFGSRVIEGGGRRWRFPLAKTLVSAQVALSFVLIVGAALFTQSFMKLVNLDAGYERESVLNARFDTRLARFEPTQLPSLYDRLLAEVARVPGVQSATIGISGPASGSIRSSTVVIEGRETAPGDEPYMHEDWIGPGYIPTLGMRIVSGRDFDSRDRVDGQPVVIVNETFVTRYLAGQDVLGRQIGYGGDSPKYTIVGVAADVLAQGQRSQVHPTAYYPLAQGPSEYARNLYARVSLDPEAMVGPIRRALESAAPELAIREIATLAEFSERTVATERMVARLATAFSGIGVVVALLGLYGAIAYSVARRTNEIGVRLALGAAPAGVRWLIVRETLMVVAAGLLAGVALVFPAGALAEALLYGLNTYDPRTLALAALAVVIAGAAIGAIPAWRASRVDPVTALRD